MELGFNPATRSAEIYNVKSTSKTAESEQEKKLKKSCQDFEAVFMNNLMKAMRKTVTKSDIFGSSKEEELFQDMMDTQICESAAKNSSIGIADMLYSQLRPQIDGAVGQAIKDLRGNDR